MLSSLYKNRLVICRICMAVMLATGLFLLRQVAQPASAAPSAAPNLPVVYISGTIGTSTWNSSNLYWVSADATVGATATLTIEGGTIVKFASGADLVVDGILVLNGTQGNEVVFTSLRDDTYDGDTNGDGGNTLPAPADWNFITLQNSSTTFQWAIVRYGRGLQIKNSLNADISPYIHHNVFESNLNGIAIDINSSFNVTSLIENNVFTGNSYGFRVSQLPSKTGTALPTLRNNDFNANTTLPIYLAGSAFPTYDNNTFSGYPLPAQRLGIGLGGTFYSNGSLPLVYDTPGGTQLLPYVVLSDMTVADGYTLHLPLDTIVKFDIGKQLVIRGVLTSDATAGDPTIFTSIRDDTFGGDTNGDGSNLEPKPGDWRQISFINKNIVFQNARVRYAYNGVYYNNATTAAPLTPLRPTIQNCTFDNDVNGLAFQATDNVNSRSEPLISSNSFSNLIGFTFILTNTNYLTYTGNTFTSNLHPSIVVTGKWHTSGRWVSVPGDGGINMPYLVPPTSVTVMSGAVVTLPGSSVVKFVEGAETKMVVNGELALESTPATRIIFTSYRDDSYAGDTNGDAVASVPAKGSWKGIYLHNSVNHFHDALVKYSNLGLVVENTTANPLSPLIEYCRFEQNTYGVFLDIQGAGDISALIQYSTFDQNDYGLGTGANASIPALGISLPTLNSNNFTNHVKFPIYLGGAASPTYVNNTFSGNAHRAIALGGFFGDNATLTLVPGDSNSPFNGKNFPYVVINDMTIYKDAILTIPATTIIKFDAGKRITANGGLLLQSNAANKIYFTSYKHDHYDDTNADGFTTTPAISDWSGVYIAGPATTNFEYTILKYANEGLVIFQNGTVDLYPVITQNEFSSNNKAITLHIKSSYDITSSIANNSIFSNNYGLYTYSDTSTDARYFGCANPTLSNNMFNGHAQFPIYLNGSSDPLYINNSFGGNTHPAIALGGYWACDATWTTVNGDDNDPFPYVVLNYITQDFPSTISIPANTVIKFSIDTGMYAWGLLNMLSSPGNEIIFTSYRDDSYAGDTNDDGTATQPSRSDWKAVWLCDLPSKTNRIHDLIAHHAVSALGVYYNGAVNTSVSSIITNTLLSENHSGILLAVRGDSTTGQGRGDIAARIQDVTMDHNNYGLLTFATVKSSGISRPELKRVTFSNTAYYPIYLGGTAYPSFVDSAVMASAPEGTSTSEMVAAQAAAPALGLDVDAQVLPGVADYLAQARVQSAAPEEIASPAAGLSVSTLSPAIALAGVFNNAGELTITNTVYVVVGNYPVYLVIDGVTTTVDNDWTIGAENAANSRVTFNAGSIIKFGAGRKLTVNGGLNLESTASQPVVFTSIKDDTAGGDTNLDGNTTTPAAGNWVGVKLTSSDTKFNYAALRYATEGLHVYFKGAVNQNISPETSHSTFSNNTTGITLWADGAGDIMSPVGNPGIHDNIFSNNTTHILGHANGTNPGRLLVGIHNNNFWPVTSYGINNLSTNYTISATQNYWGNPTGPYHLTLNPTGKGVTVSDRVNFDPWSTVPFNQGATYTIHGRIIKSDPNDPQPGIAGVTVTVQPGNRTTITDQDGYYSLAGFLSGKYTVLPTLSGWLFAPSQATVDLVTDATVDFVGTLGTSDYYVTIGNASVVQMLAGNVNAQFVVSLSKASSVPVMVDYQTQDGTAVASSDYTATGLKTVTFLAGEVSKTITVVVKPGPQTEGEEYFRVVLSNPRPTSVNLLPNGEFGTCTIVPVSNVVYIPLVKKR